MAAQKEYGEFAFNSVGPLFLTKKISVDIG